ncbi:LysR family transcriptional regulator [Erwinia sp.]|uniref:LysR family transcriptional regulator n=1 Tax=Erwinia citreus TaxID=558 RepID=UPI003C75820C
MNSKPDLTALNAFVLVATRRSFRQAADELGLSPSTLSHMLRALEEKMAVRLLHRTTRSVSTTEAGEQLLKQLKPVLQGLESALSSVEQFRQQPAGTLRINASESAARQLLQQVVPLFLQRYPAISLDLVTEGRLIDIVSEQFDAGVRLFEDVPQDMVAVPFGGDLRFIAVASPAYVAKNGQPATPDDLLKHQCIRFRLPSGKLYRWEFSRRGVERHVEVKGALMLDHLELMVESAAAGLGIAYVPSSVAEPWLESGKLQTMLEEWSPPSPGLALYYPGHRHVPAALRAFIDVVKSLPVTPFPAG